VRQRHEEELARIAGDAPRSPPGSASWRRKRGGGARPRLEAERKERLGEDDRIAKLLSNVEV
jgi:hypothetical protein